ncbi:MAG: leucyl/phenylalanyl-tRNA--protein transferase [Chloroflexaceae bacterium]|nr:leucyl/phenylalanyl-tRNA--protein transferase [Chloroflexaceae bacterium]
MILNPHLLISAYCQGIFPMADERGAISWYDPDPRAIIPLETFHVPRRLRRTVRRGRFEIRVDCDFCGVMQACAEPSPYRGDTWISAGLVESYTLLHQMNLAHSVETWLDGRLVGGLYGVAIRGLFAGESMFSRETDASKVALVALVERLQRGGFVLLDTQFLTDHLSQFGAIEISRDEYQLRLAQALQVDATFEPAVAIAGR